MRRTRSCRVTSGRSVRPNHFCLPIAEALEPRQLLSSDPVTIAVGMGAARSVQFTDPSGTQATIFVAGPGSANARFNGTGITQSVTTRGVVLGGSGVTLATVAANGTNGKSVLHIDVKGRGIIASGSITSTQTLGSIHATHVAVTGDVTVGGWVHFLQLAGVQSGTITIGSAHLANATLIANLGNVADVNLTSGVAVAGLSANQWVNSGAGTTTIQAPRIQSLIVKNNFAAGLTLTAPGKAQELGSFHAAGITGGAWNLAGSAGTISAGTISGWTATIGGTVASINVSHDASANLTAGAINSMSVRGTLAGSSISLINPPSARGLDLGSLSVGGDIVTTTVRSVGSIGSIHATLMHDSQIYAGIINLPAGLGLPAQPANFASAAKIQSVTLRRSASASFANSDIAAYTINGAALGAVAFANGGTPFGIAAHQLRSISLTDQTTGKTVHSGNVVSTAAFNGLLASKGIAGQDFVVRIV